MNLLEMLFNHPLTLSLLRKLKRLSSKEKDVKQKKLPMQRQQKIVRRGKRKRKKEK
jgi:hypothetical protein